ncbi:hypothetical protein GPU89_03770 [Burkholderia cepacia]|nr:hypothetical protein [Burkholderia cepacia]
METVDALEAECDQQQEREDRAFLDGAEIGARMDADVDDAAGNDQKNSARLTARVRLPTAPLVSVAARFGMKGLRRGDSEWQAIDRP